MKPLIVGEQPSKTSTPTTPPLQGRIGRRLAELAGLTWSEYYETFERVNLLPVRAEYSGQSTEWNVRAAREAAATIRLHFAPTRIVLVLGKRAAAALDLRTEYFELQPVENADVYVIPHPSGVNRWYNDPVNEQLARAFLACMVAQLRADRKVLG